jgi:hypothetical protein
VNDDTPLPGTLKRVPPGELKKVATLHNDGPPHGRFEWEPGEGPPEPDRMGWRGWALFLVVTTLAAGLATYATLPAVLRACP